jgi:hypothetical protein
VWTPSLAWMYRVVERRTAASESCCGGGGACIYIVVPLCLSLKPFLIGPTSSSSSSLTDGRTDRLGWLGHVPKLPQ